GLVGAFSLGESTDPAACNAPAFLGRSDTSAPGDLRADLLFVDEGPRPAELLACLPSQVDANLEMSCFTDRANRSNRHTRTASNCFKRASAINRSRAGRRSFAPLQPWSTYSFTIVKLRCLANSRNAASWVSGSWPCCLVETRAYRATVVMPPRLPAGACADR